MALDKLQRALVESIQNNTNFTSLEIGDSKMTFVPDKILAHDLALAVQAHLNRRNKELYGKR